MAMLQLAVQQGGRRLDAFDTVLPDVYSARRLPRRWPGSPGTTRTSRRDGSTRPFREFNKGRPDVVFMVYDPTYGRIYKPGDGERFADWDPAESRQVATVADLRASEQTGTFYQPDVPEAGGARASVELGDGIARIILGAKADASSLIHEFAPRRPRSCCAGSAPARAPTRAWPATGPPSATGWAPRTARR